jgi:hypothetical protein
MSSPNSNASAHRASSDSSASPRRSSSLRITQMPSAAAQHRQSFNELRGAPPSPRSQRQPSISSLAIQELINNPPQRSAPDPKFAGRDWRTIKIQELTRPEDLRFVEADTGVEAATNVCLPSIHSNSTYVCSFWSPPAPQSSSSKTATPPSSALSTTATSTPTSSWSSA